MMRNEKNDAPIRLFFGNDTSSGAALSRSGGRGGESFSPLSPAGPFFILFYLGLSNFVAEAWHAVDARQSV